MTKHGLSKHPLYRTYENMIHVCLDPRHRDFKYYGAKGITVCDEWIGPTGFTQFSKDLGVRPNGLSLIRKDKAKPFNKDNCCWGMPRNKCRMITHNGIVDSVSGWARRLGLSKQTLSSRLKTWDVQRALESK